MNGVQEAAGSTPVTRTIEKALKSRDFGAFSFPCRVLLPAQVARFDWFDIRREIGMAQNTHFVRREGAADSPVISGLKLDKMCILSNAGDTQLTQITDDPHDVQQDFVDGVCFGLRYDVL